MSETKFFSAWTAKIFALQLRAWTFGIKLIIERICLLRTCLWNVSQLVRKQQNTSDTNVNKYEWMQQLVRHNKL